MLDKVEKLTAAMHKGGLEEGARELARQGKMGVELPEAVLKLTETYEMRTYWFEIVECARKLAHRHARLVRDGVHSAADFWPADRLLRLRRVHILCAVR